MPITTNSNTKLKTKKISKDFQKKKMFVLGASNYVSSFLNIIEIIPVKILNPQHRGILCA